MVKQTLRCTLCGKFTTFADMQDDELCWRCGERLAQEVLNETKTLRRIIYVLWVLLIITVVLLVDVWVANAQNVEYYVTGTNVTTGERVVGWLDGRMGSGEVQGTVLDRGDRFVVVGQSSGKGSFVLKSLCCEYDVVVADEVSNNKLVNRKKWEK